MGMDSRWMALSEWAYQRRNLIDLFHKSILFFCLPNNGSLRQRRLLQRGLLLVLRGLKFSIGSVGRANL